MATIQEGVDEATHPRSTRPKPLLSFPFHLSHPPRAGRPPRPLDPLPDYGIAYFHQLLSQYQMFPRADDAPIACLHPNPQAISALDKLMAKAATAVLTWEDVDRLETAMLRVLPDATLRNQAWSLRARYFEAAGPALTEMYQKAKPSDWCDATVAVELLRADLECVLSEYQKYRTFLPARDRVRDRISRRTAYWTLGGTLLGALLWVAAQMAGHHVPTAANQALTMMLTMLAGAVGGFVSVQSRLQSSRSHSLPLLDRIELETEQFSIYLAPVSGAIFAAVLYFLFMGHYLQGSLFPDVSLTGIASPLNFGGLVVWSFLAGFAERLVPDVLTRLVSRSGATEDKTPPKT